MSVGDLRQDYFTLNLAGVQYQSPGKCEFIGANDGRKWDEQAGYGLSGASLVGGGAKLSHFGVKLTLWEIPPDAAQWIAWEAFNAILKAPAPGLRPPSLGIAHPILALVGITIVVRENSTQWTQDEHGLWTMQYAFIQYRAPQVSFVTAAPGVPAASQGLPDAQTVAQARFQAAQARFTAATGPQ